MLRIKGYRETSSNFPILSFHRMQNQVFSRQWSIQYFHFTEYKTKQVHISCNASRDKFKHLIYQSCRHIDQNLIFATMLNPILSFYRMQNQIWSHITFRIKGQVQTSHLSNLQAYRPKSHFATRVNPILSFYRIQNQIGSHIMFRIKGH